MNVTRTHTPGGTKRPRRPPSIASARNRRDCASRTRCLPDSRERTRAVHPASWAAAVVLAVSGLVLPTAPADAGEDEKSAGIDYSEAGCLEEALTGGVRDAQALWSGLRVGLRRNAEEGELAGIPATVRERWLDLIWRSFPHVADEGPTRTGPQTAAAGDLLLGSAFQFTPSDAPDPDDHWLAWRQSASMGAARGYDARGDGPMSLFAADCERGRLLATMVPTEWLPVWSALDDATAELAPTLSCGEGSEGPLRRSWAAIGTCGAHAAVGDTISSRPGAFGMSISSDAVPDTDFRNPTAVETSRVRRVPDGSREFEAGSGGIVAPSRETGLAPVGGAVGTSVKLEVALSYGTQ